MKFFRYLSYVVRHKWWVLVEACRLGIPWRGITHDLSKLHPAEFIPYMNYFGGSRNAQRGRDKSGYYDANAAADAAFRQAWQRHQRGNDHHWEWWTFEGHGGHRISVEMSYDARREMLADWRGAGRAQGKGNDVLAFYTANKDRMVLGPATRAWLEKEIGFKS